MRACCAGRGAAHVSPTLDEAAVRRAAGAPIDIVRDGDFVAFTADERDRGDARGRSRARAGALGRRRPAARRRRRAGLAQGAALARPHRGNRRGAGAPRGNRVVEASFSRPFLTYGSIGPSCALAEFKDGALKVWSHSQGLFDAARLARARARPRSRAGHGVAPPGRRRLRPQHRRRRRVRCRLRRDAHAGPHRAGAMVARGRVLGRADQHRPWSIGLRAVLDADKRARPTGRSKSGARRTPSVRA